jgi:nucleoside-diphosphate-sugar epimerase
MPKTVVTGGAGFIGFHTTRALLARGESVVGAVAGGDPAVADHRDLSPPTLAEWSGYPGSGE